MRPCGYPAEQARRLTHSASSREVQGPMSIDPRAPSRQLVTLVSEVVADDHSKELLHEAGFALRERFDIGPLTSERELEAALQNAWAVVAGAESYSNSLLDRLPDLRVIARPGAGHDAIDLTAATAHDVLVFVTPGANADAVADMTIGLILACLRQIPAADRAVRSDRWREGALGGDLYGSTVGIVGLGRIGRGVARRLRGFDVTVLGCDPLRIRRRVSTIRSSSHRSTIYFDEATS